MGALDRQGGLGGQVTSPKSNAIHRDPVKGRKWAVGHEILPQNPPEGFRQRNGLDRKKVGVLQKEVFRRLRGDQGHGRSLPF
jgi:hypothetical protein